MSEERWVVEVDKHTCVGTALCAGSYPDLFAIVSGTAEPVNAQIAPDEDAVDAADSCPMEAIRITKAATGELVAPSQ